MDLSTLATVEVVVVLLLGFLVNYLFEPDIRKSSANMVFLAFAVLLIYSSFKMLYTGEMATFNVQEGEVKIFMGTHLLEFWASLIFKFSLGSLIIYALFLKIRKK
jgi:hypothetical protein